jgi:8-oxo-dGTP pyrophosphatase MutT (NUDIX family)
VNVARAANIRPAASVLVLRDGERGVELLLMRRPERGDNDFRNGACVFPGGVLDAADRQAWRWCLGLDDATASARLGLPEGGLDYFVAALRECFEEAGLLFVCRSDGAPADLAPHAETLRQWRSRLHRGEAGLAALCEAFDWRLDLREMAYFSHWLTPVIRPKRFDTRFFVRLAPPGQQAMPDFGEALELMWLTPDEALDPQRALKLLNVTQRTLHDMRGFASARAAFAHALALRGVALHFPRPALGRDGPRFIIENDPAYDEVARLDPDGRGGARCELAPGELTQLSPRLWRIHGRLACTYLVTDNACTEAAVIDADATDAARWQALCAWSLAPVRRLLFTQAGDAQAPVLRARWPQAGGAAAVGQSVKLGQDATLLAVPGNAGHLAFLLQEERTLVGSATDEALLQAAPGVEWLAPRFGFMQRKASA